MGRVRRNNGKQQTRYWENATAYSCRAASETEVYRKDHLSAVRERARCTVFRDLLGMQWRDRVREKRSGSDADSGEFDENCRQTPADGAGSERRYT